MRKRGNTRKVKRRLWVLVYWDTILHHWLYDPDVLRKHVIFVFKVSKFMKNKTSETSGSTCRQSQPEISLDLNPNPNPRLHGCENHTACIRNIFTSLLHATLRRYEQLH